MRSGAHGHSVVCPEQEPAGVRDKYPETPKKGSRPVHSDDESLGPICYVPLLFFHLIFFLENHVYGSSFTFTSLFHTSISSKQIGKLLVSLTVWGHTSSGAVK